LVPLRLTKQDLPELPGIVSSFNGLYSTRRVFLLYRQSRILLALGLALIVAFVLCGLLLRWYIRCRRGGK
jgi:hydroxyacylglutathione hydrolase